jgi:hypothetical protein
MLATPAVERSTYAIVISFFDEAGDPVTPVTAKWTLTDDTGEVINQRSAVAITPLGETATIVLHGADLALSNSHTRRLVTIEATYNSSLGNGLELTAQEEFLITPLVKVE